MSRTLTPLQTAIRYGALALVALTVLSVALFSAISGTKGLWGALIGSAFGGGFILITLITVVATAKASPQTGGAVLLGSWLVKLVVAFVIIFALKSQDFYSKPALGITVILALIIVLGAEVLAVVRTKVPYVDTGDDADIDSEPETDPITD